MLNELLVVERGARRAGLEMAERHPDIKEARGVPRLLVQLAEAGHVVSVRPVPRTVALWTLRDGQQNSFPFMQPKPPLWLVPQDDQRRDTALDRNSPDRRMALLELAEVASFDDEAFKNWPGDGLLNRLRERRQQLTQLENTESAVVPATIDRFLLACGSTGGGPQQLLAELIRQLINGLRQTAQDDWIEPCVALLLGSFNRKNGQWECAGALHFEAAAHQASITEPKLATCVTEALTCAESGSSPSEEIGICSLTGDKVRLLSGNFPQPNLPILGQTYLFAKNRDIGANDRYGRFAVESMPVGECTTIRLAAAFAALTADEREGLTWRRVPGAAPKQSDLLLAFVEQALDVPAARTLADDAGDEDLAEEAPQDAAPDAAGSIAAFEKRTERIIEAVSAKVHGDFRNTPVRLAIFRKVDPANRKVIYAGAPTVGGLYDAAINWSAGERNVPPWIVLPVLRKREQKPRAMPPPHVAPLGLIAFSRQLFLRGGVERQEIVGLPASEAMGLFLDQPETGDGSARRRLRRVLRLIYSRRVVLVAGAAHALRRGFDAARRFDRREVLRTVTLLGVLTHKLGRTKEDYMNDAAFKLGQLLAAADVVHAGYCADVRGGAVPPSLLGNQVFTMAQSTPVKALAMLCRRWKPYDGWAKKANRERGRIEEFMSNVKNKQRGWDIKKALRHAREMRPLADDLAPALKACTVDDAFRAELLLGYIAGLPKVQKEDSDGEHPAVETNE